MKTEVCSSGEDSAAFSIHQVDAACAWSRRRHRTVPLHRPIQGISSLQVLPYSNLPAWCIFAVQSTNGDKVNEESKKEHESEIVKVVTDIFARRLGFWQALSLRPNWTMTTGQAAFAQNPGKSLRLQATHNWVCMAQKVMVPHSLKAGLNGDLAAKGFRTTAA